MERIVRRSAFTFSLHFSKFRFVSPFISAINFNNNTLLYRNFTQYDIDKSKEIHKNNVKTSSSVDNKVINTVSSSREAPTATALTVLVKQSTDPSFAELHIPPSVEYVAGLLESALMKLKMQDISPSTVILKDEKTKKVLDPTVSMIEALHQNVVYKGQKLIVSISSKTIEKTTSGTKIITDEPMSKLVTAINKHSTVHRHEYGDTIELENARWFGLKSNKLLVRKFYNHVVENLMENFENTSKNRFIILGAPGISKSGFGNYLLYSAIRLKRTIVYANGKRKGVYYLLKYDAEHDKHQISASTHYLAYNDYLLDSRTVFISDTMDFTPYFDAFSVLITSPNITRWKDFYHDDIDMTSRIVFNPLTRNECQLLRKTCFPSVSETEVDMKFKQWGGNARYIFNLPLSLSKLQFNQVLRAQNISLDILANMHNLGLEQPPNEIIHRLFHLRTMGFNENNFDESLFSDPNFYEFKDIQMASEEIAQFFRDECNRVTMVALSNVIRSANPEVLKMFLKGRGELFEMYARDELKDGGKFNCFSLGSDSIHQEVIIPKPPSTSILRYNNLNEFAANYTNHPDELMFGVQKSNFPTIDTIFGGTNLGNMTVNMKHEILLGNANKSDDAAGGLLQILHTLRIDYTTTKIKFYWIVPPDIYYEWYKKRTDLSPFTIYDTNNKPHDISKGAIVNAIDSVDSKNRVVRVTSGKTTFLMNQKYVDLVKNIEQYVMYIEFKY